MSGNRASGRRHLCAIFIRTRWLALGAGLALASLAVSADEVLPYRVVDGVADESTYLGWRLFHSTCHGCHGVDATGTSVAPNLVESVKRLSPRAFSTKVLTRYRITVSAQASASDNKTDLRDEFIQEVLRRERGEVLMPAWEEDPNVKPHLMDIYAYLRARADGALTEGRPKRAPKN